MTTMAVALDRNLFQACEYLKRKFYEEELQQILKEGDTYKVEKVLKTRKRSKKTEYFVQWKDYDKSLNFWTSDIFDVQKNANSVVQSA